MNLIDKLKEVREYVANDPHVNPNEKESVLSFLNGPDPFGHLVAGGIGAGVANTITSFMKLNDTTKALITVAGFGLGSVLANTLVRNTNTYVEQTDEGRIKINI
jgi:hypothetical protein